MVAYYYFSVCCNQAVHSPLNKKMKKKRQQFTEKNDKTSLIHATITDSAIMLLKTKWLVPKLITQTLSN